MSAVTEDGTGEPTELDSPELARTEVDLPAHPTEAEAQGDAPEASRRIGRFRIEAKIGSGGMADVHRAYDPLLERTVALKVLHTVGLIDETRQRRRLLREARAVAGLAHPNTVTIYEVGEASGQVFIAMELLDGEVLRTALRRETPLEVKLRWLLEAARALEAAHKRGLVHRDVKPENMFVCAGGPLKLLDFGIAKRDEDDSGEGSASLGPSSLRTAAGRRVGTPRYMAPEQKAGAPTDPRTDQYAWGLVAFEVLTGSHATTGVSTLKAEGSSHSGEGSPEAERIARLRKVPELHDDIVRTIVRTLEVSKEARFESMTPICTLFEEALSAAAAAAPPVVQSPPRRLWLVALAVGTLATVLGGGGTLFARARRAGLASTAKHAPSCKVGAARAYPASRNDRMTVAAGAIVIAREDAHLRDGDSDQKQYEIESAGRLEPFNPSDSEGLEMLKGMTTEMRGGTMGGRPALVFHGASLLWVTGPIGTDKVRRRFMPALDSVAVTSFKDSLVVAVSRFDISSTDVSRGWLELVAVTNTNAVQQASFNLPLGGRPRSPALAATDERVALAFLDEAPSIRFAFVGERAEITGDVMTVARVDASPAVAFVGKSPVVLWNEMQSGARRLVSTMLAPGGTTFGPKTVAIDEAIADYAPMTARLSSGVFAVVWVAARDGMLVLRTATLVDGGVLAAPLDVATASGARDLTVSSTASGLDVAWIDDRDHFARTVSVTCAAGP